MKFVVTFGVGALAVKLVRFVEGGWGLGAVFPALGVISCLLVSVIVLLVRITPRMRS
jgi:hypothetical protein